MNRNRLPEPHLFSVMTRALRILMVSPWDGDLRQSSRWGRSSSMRRCSFAFGPESDAWGIARKHPGASPSAIAPEGIRAGVVELAPIDFGHDNQPANPTPAPQPVEARLADRPGR
ncbi:MAG TPA: hypothetical protein VFP81_08095 [Propionibacteriaceae bacterium]|nr:hypothetical protein [Propionibacteriaceae bacterium]